jgi:hypothetical protein
VPSFACGAQAARARRKTRERGGADAIAKTLAIRDRDQFLQQNSHVG